MLTVIVIYVILCLCLYVYWDLTKDNRLLAKIPGPRDFPIVGNSYSFLLPPEKVFIHLRHLYKCYRGINQAYAINVRTVNIYDPKDVETIMSTTRFNTKKKPYLFLKPWLNEGLLVSNGEKWHQRRKLLTKAFHFNILRRYMPTFIEQTECFLKRIENEGGKPIDVVPLVSRTTLQIICETAMGSAAIKSSRTIKKYFNAVHEFGLMVAERICRAWLYFDFTYKLSGYYNVQKRFIPILHDFTTGIIKLRKEEVINNNTNGEDFNEDSDQVMYGVKGRLGMLDLLLQNEKEGTINFDGIREEVDTFMFEGHDTMAMGLSLFILRIANEPIIQGKIYEEMQRIFGDSDRSPTMEDLSEMKYLEFCIKESLRLYPSVPVVARYATEEVTLSGFKVPVGTIINIHIFDIHRNEEIYPQPEEFIPERFTLENSATRHPYAYIPFSAGPRNCIGQKFAMMELKILTSGLLRKFQLEPITKHQDLVFRIDIVLRTAHPFFVKFTARK